MLLTDNFEAWEEPDNLEQEQEQEQEQQKAQMWELFALIMDFDPDYTFTAKELSKQLSYSKSDLNKLLFRLYLNKALKMHQKTEKGTLYSLNKSFFTDETEQE